MITLNLPDSTAAHRTGRIKTSDGVQLHYLESGSGLPLVLVPGWSQTAAMFQRQLDGLAGDCRVLALDMRGHGESEKPEHGYRFFRFFSCDRPTLTKRLYANPSSPVSKQLLSNLEQDILDPLRLAWDIATCLHQSRLSVRA
jgi:pimeloyl-ACP methyl ester carboxylesterase